MDHAHATILHESQWGCIINHVVIDTLMISQNTENIILYGLMFLFFFSHTFFTKTAQEQALQTTVKITIFPQH